MLQVVRRLTSLFTRKWVAYALPALFLSSLHNIFLVFHVDLFVSVYHISESQFWIAESIFMIWNSINDMVFGWASDSGALNGSAKKDDASAPSRPRSAPLLAPPLVPPEWTEERLTPTLASLSPLQVLAAVPEFGSYCAAAPQIFRSAPSDPTQDAVTQLAKVAEGLLTARYAADHHHRPIHRHRPFSAAAIITTTARCPA